MCAFLLVWLILTSYPGAVLRWGRGISPSPKPEPCPQIFCCSSSKTSKQLLQGAFLEGWSGWFGSFGLRFEGDDWKKSTLCLASPQYFPLEPPLILSRTVSKLLEVIGQICAFDRGYLSLRHSFGMKPCTYDREIWHQTRNIALSCGVKRFTMMMMCNDLMCT